MRRRARAAEDPFDDVSSVERQEWLLDRIATDVRTVRNIIVTWWWLVWIGVAITFVSAVVTASQ